MRDCRLLTMKNLHPQMVLMDTTSRFITARSITKMKIMEYRSAQLKMMILQRMMVLQRMIFFRNMMPEMRMTLPDLLTTKAVILNPPKMMMFILIPVMNQRRI